MTHCLNQCLLGLLRGSTVCGLLGNFEDRNELGQKALIHCGHFDGHLTNTGVKQRV